MNKKYTWKSYAESSLWAQSQGIKSASEWRQKCLIPGWRPIDIPSDPSRVYFSEFKNGGWKSFFGTSIEYVSIKQASAWAKSQKIRSQLDWFEKCGLSNFKPKNIPISPSRYYGAEFKKFGGWGGFLGTNNVAVFLRDFKNIEEASAWAKLQNIASKDEWRQNCNKLGWRPTDIPSNPAKTYGVKFKEFGGWGGFLGTNTIAPQMRKFRSIEDASLWARAQGVVSSSQWKEKCSTTDWLPIDIPACPSKVYKEEFVKNGGWMGFLGIKNQYQTSKIERILRFVLEDVFSQKHEIAQSRVVGRSGKCWKVDVALSDAKLIVEYDGKRWHEKFLERDIRKTNDLSTHEEGWIVVRVRGNGLPLVQKFLDVNVDENESHAKQVYFILTHLLFLHDKNKICFSGEQINKIKMWNFDKLKSYDFSNHLNIYNEYLDISLASEWAKKQKIKNVSEWRSFSKPTNIPSNPLRFYGQKFIDFGGWNEFLGTKNLRFSQKNFTSLEDASNWAREKKLSSRKDWKESVKIAGWLPSNIPSNPQFFYGEGFKENGGWGGFLGNHNVANHLKKFRSFDDASDWAFQKGVKSSIEWRNLCKIPGWRPADIPMSPDVVFKDFHIRGGWNVFLKRSPTANMKIT